MVVLSHCGGCSPCVVDALLAAVPSAVVTEDIIGIAPKSLTANHPHSLFTLTPATEIVAEVKFTASVAEHSCMWSTPPLLPTHPRTSTGWASLTLAGSRGARQIPVHAALLNPRIHRSKRVVQDLSPKVAAVGRVVVVMHGSLHRVAHTQFVQHRAVEAVPTVVLDAQTTVVTSTVFLWHGDNTVSSALKQQIPSPEIHCHRLNP
eukprot:m.274840 g.274840  ORF g.274840 m.274840 type:complete len:205 (-) comp19762_c0_seq28:1472-2086(-)